MSPSSLNVRKARLAYKELVGAIMGQRPTQEQLARMFEDVDREAGIQVAALNRSYNLPRAKGADV